MAKKNAALLFGFCFALTACADSATSRSVTAPVGMTGESFSIAANVGAAQATTGGRASGHADITRGTPPACGIEFFGCPGATGGAVPGPSGETYSFVALSTGTFPNAKGQLEGHFVSPSGEFEVHLDINCLMIAGNRAVLSGTVKKYVVNGEDLVGEGRVPPDYQAAVIVQDNGEGANAAPDQATFIHGFYIIPQVCRILLGDNFLTLPSENGNIQVSDDDRRVTR